MKIICFHVDTIGDRQWLRRDDVGGDDAYAMVPMFCIAVRNEVAL